MSNMTFAASVVAELFERQFGNFVNHLNYGMEVLDLFEMTKTSFNGAYFEYPTTVARAGHGRYQGEGARQPTPRSLNDEVVKFSVSEYIDKLGFTWRFLSQGDSSLLKSKIKRRINRAFEENREFLDQVSIYGNATRGLINERMFVAGAPNTPILCGAGAPVAGLNRTVEIVVDYSGDHTRFSAAVLANPTTWVPVTLRLLDDYGAVAVGNAIVSGGGANTGHLFVTGSSELAGTVTLVLVSDNAGTGLLIDSTTIADGFAIGVELDNTTAVNGVAIGTPQYGNIDPATGVAYTGDASYEMAGIFHNLFYGMWGDKDRSTAAYLRLRSTGLTMATSGTHSRAGFSAERVSHLIQTVKIAAGRAGKFTHMLGNPLIMTRLIAAITVTTEYQVKGPAGKADLGPSSVLMLGYELKECLNMPNGMIVGINKACWEILTVGGKMIDIIKRGDASGVIGGPLFKSSDVTTSSDTVFYGIHQLVCDRPNSAGAICGIDLV